MAISGGAFNAEQFRKIVAMFDAEIEVADSAFRRAFAELKNNGLRFCDVLVDTEEAKRTKKERDGLVDRCARHQAEADKYRSERDEYLARCTRQQAEAAELENANSRLHELIREMEEQAAVNHGPSPGGQDDWLPRSGNRPPEPSPRARPAPGHMSKIYDHLASGVSTGVSEFTDRVASKAYTGGRAAAIAAGKIFTVIFVLLLIFLAIVIIGKLSN